MRDPLAPFLAHDGVALLDGGLATELEARGCDLDHPLWSARVLRDRPEAIVAVHRAYLEAGADVVTTASYQATLEGFAREGLDRAAARGLLLRSVELAAHARDAFASRRLVAASIGPYGAFLANGAEYTGDYDLDEVGLVAFHRERFSLLADSGADLLACETIPSAAEARALVRLLDETKDAVAWLSFSCRDDARLSDGTPFADIVREVGAHPRVVAVGVNCTAPQYVESLLRSASEITTKTLVAYPNSGERYDAATKTWHGEANPGAWGELGRRWRHAGARLIGGCCRTGPAHIRSLRTQLR